MYFVSRVLDKRFVRPRSPEERAIALQHSYGDGDMDQSFSRGIEDRSAIAHEGEYTICDEGLRRRRSVSASDHLLHYAALDLLSLRGGPKACSVHRLFQPHLFLPFPSSLASYFQL